MSPRKVPEDRAESVRVRAARVRDAEAMRAIYNDAIRTTTATFDTTPRSRPDQMRWLESHDGRHPVLVATLGGKTIGWASLSPWSDRHAYDGTAETSVYVAAEWRGHGVGRALMSSILSAASRLRFHTLLARVAEGNPASRRLHRSAGFEVVGVMHEVGYKFGRFLNVELLELAVPDRGSPRPPKPRPRSSRLT